MTFKMFLVACSVLWRFFLILEVLGESPSGLSILDKFHQNDYRYKLERFELVSYNKNILNRAKIITFKHNRTCTATNFTMDYKIDVGKKLEVVVQGHKFMSNEYRHFPMRFQVNVCLAISENMGGMKDLVNQCGNFSGCPILKGHIIHICNWVPDEYRLPPFMPSGRYMMEIQMLYDSTEVEVIRSYGEIYRPIPWS